MKRGFSIGEALGAPFVLLRRRPISVFVWGLLRFVATAAMFAVFVPFLPTLLAAGGQGGGRMDDAAMGAVLQMEAGVQGLNLLNLVVGMVVFSAILRAVQNLERREGFAHLRLGMDEVRIAVAVIAIAIGAWLAAVVLILLGAALGFGVASLGEPAQVGVLIVYGVVATLALLWGVARVILIVPLSLMQKTFAFDEGWDLGKGQAWRLIATAFLAWIVMFLVEIIGLAVLIAAGVGLAVAMGVVMPDAAALTTPQGWIAALRPLAVPAAILAIPACFLLGLMQALWAAPLASAAVQLAGTAPSDDAGGDKVRKGKGKGGRPLREPFPDLAMPAAASPAAAEEAHGHAAALAEVHAPEAHPTAQSDAPASHPETDEPALDGPGHDAEPSEGHGEDHGEGHGDGHAPKRATDTSRVR